MSKQFKATVIAAGRVTIPQDVRVGLGIQEGDDVLINITKIKLVVQEVN